MKENICLFGATTKDDFFIKNKKVLGENGYNITYVVGNHNFESEHNCTIIGFDKFDIKKVIKESDIIIICESPQCTDAYIFSLLKKLLLHDKKIYNYHALDLFYELELTKLVNPQSKYYYFGKPNLSLTSLNISGISIPVIYVMSLFEDMGKMNMELSLNRILCERGYRAGVISSNSKGQFFGIASFPFSLFGKTISIEETANNFFEYVNDYVSVNKLDVLIIGIPSVLFNPYNNFDVSIPLYLIKKVCPPDYIILNILNNTLNNNSIEDIDNLVLDEINKPIDALFISSTIDDVVIYEDTKPTRSFSITQSASVNTLSSSKLIITEIDEDNYDLIVNDIENKLG